MRMETMNGKKNKNLFNYYQVLIHQIKDLFNQIKNLYYYIKNLLI